MNRRYPYHIPRPRPRAPGSLNAQQVRDLGVRIVACTKRLRIWHANQIAQLCAQIGLAYCSRPKLAEMLGISRRTLDRALAELDGKALAVVAERGRGGGTVLIPTFVRIDPANLGARIRGALSHARRVPRRARAILNRALAKIRQPWQVESREEILNPSPTPETPPVAVESRPPKLPTTPKPPPRAFQQAQARLEELLAGLPARIRGRPA